jgi:hypothetical protein
MKKLSMTVIVLCASSACSWENTLSHVTSYPAQTRLISSSDLRNAPRWIANANTRFLIQPEIEEDNAAAYLISAAQSGLDQITGRATGPVINLSVDWPNAGQIQRRAKGTSLLGVHLPSPGNATESLPVHLLSLHGEHLHSLHLRISPSLLGEPWHAEVQVERAFAKLATSLLGG